MLFFEDAFFADEAEGVRSRLRGVVQRMAVSDEEVVEVLGDGVL